MNQSISLFVLAAALGVGCAATHEPTGVAPGVYELTLQTDVDACSPMRPAGSMGAVAVLVHGTTLDVPVSDGAGATVLTASRVRLEEDAAFHAETNRRLAGCGDAWVHEEWTVMETMDEGFDVLMRQDYRGLDSCEESPEPLPSQDCVAERTMGFRLDTACYAPCSLRLGVGGALACTCS